jgi:hypothetical protein
MSSLLSVRAMAMALFRGALLYAALPMLLLAVAEVALRLAGVGESGDWLLEKRAEDAVFHVPSQRFYQQFTALPLEQIVNWDELDFVVPAKKQEGTLRIFAFGESALYGTRSAPRILAAMLEAAYPDRRFEVFNTSCPGMNSHVLRAIAREAARRQPDLFLLYMGNNESVGPFGPSTPIGRSEMLANNTAIQALIALNGLRLMQLAGSAVHRPAVVPTEAQVAASIPGQSEQEKVNQRFADNVRAIIAAGENAGARVLLCTLGSNADFRGERDPGAGRGGANAVLLDVAAQHKDDGFSFVDVDLELDEAARAYASQYVFFTDNIHFTFEGAYTTAKVMFAETVRLLGLPPAEPLGLEEAAERMAWGAAAQIDLLRTQVAAGFDPYSREILREKLAKLEQQAPADLHAAMAAEHDKALALRPHDLYLLHGRFLALLYGNRPAEARAAAEALLAAHPHARVALRAMAQAHAANGNSTEAIAAFERTLACYPDDKAAAASLKITREGAP